MASKQVYWFSYYMPKRGIRPLSPHQLRDGAAYSQVSAILYGLGYEYGDLLLNYPSAKHSKARRVDTSFFNSTDILAVTTRPPLDDTVGGAKKKISRSNTSLEAKLFKVLRANFAVVTRDQVRLAKRIAQALPEKFADRAHIHFRQNVGASYRYVKRIDQLKWQKPLQQARTALYLVVTPSLWDDGPRALVAFGMGGSEGLLWAYLLRKRYWEELNITLETPRFIMAELITRKFSVRAHDLAFADKWRLEILLDVSL